MTVEDVDENDRDSLFPIIPNILLLVLVDGLLVIGDRVILGLEGDIGVYTGILCVVLLLVSLVILLKLPLRLLRDNILSLLLLDVE